MLMNPRAVGAVWPTSRRAVSDLLDLEDLAKAKLVLEFGVGSGVYTAGILDRLSPEARLVAFEVDREMARSVSGALADKRLEVVPDSAERAVDYLRGERAGVVVSSLPFTTLPGRVGDDILDLVGEVLAPGGSFLVLQYSRNILPKLEARFERIERKTSPLNIPPAVLYRCSLPKSGVSGG